jgi:hypothetical protein
LIPESELEEIREKVKADEAKSNVLEKLELDKQLQKEIDKQASEKEAEADELDGDVDGFHLFKEEYDIPYQDYQPSHKLDIEEESDDQTDEQEGEPHLDSQDGSDIVDEFDNIEDPSD